MTYDKNEIKKIPITSLYDLGISKKVFGGYLYKNCPFCSHKWHLKIDIEKNLFYSHSACVSGGSVIDFIMRLYNKSFQESISFIGENSNLQTSSFKRKSTLEENIDKKINDMIEKKIDSFFHYANERMFFKGYSLLDDKIKLFHAICMWELKGDVNIC